MLLLGGGVELFFTINSSVVMSSSEGKIFKNRLPFISNFSPTSDRCKLVWSHTQQNIQSID